MNKEEIEELKDFTIDLTDIDELALGLEVCSKKSNMVIQEFADTIIQLQQENQELKLEFSGYRQAILKDKEMLGLKEENDKLNKQLEEDYTSVYLKGCEDTKYKYKTQQKEFIEYLENEIERNRKEATCMVAYNNNVLPLKEILSKYKEIIGGKDEKI